MADVTTTGDDDGRRRRHRTSCECLHSKLRLDHGDLFVPFHCDLLRVCAEAAVDNKEHEIINPMGIVCKVRRCDIITKNRDCPCDGEGVIVTCSCTEKHNSQSHNKRHHLVGSFHGGGGALSFRGWRNQERGGKTSGAPFLAITRSNPKKSLAHLNMLIDEIEAGGGVSWDLSAATTTTVAAVVAAALMEEDDYDHDDDDEEEEEENNNKKRKREGFL